MPVKVAAELAPAMVETSCWKVAVKPLVASEALEALIFLVVVPVDCLLLRPVMFDSSRHLQLQQTWARPLP